MNFKLFVFGCFLVSLTIVKANLTQGKCTQGYVECETGGVCLQEKYLCDGHADCQDESDEKYCGKETTYSTETATQYEVTTLSNIEELAREALAAPATSEETVDASSIEKEPKFAMPDDADHCVRYRRMINLVRKVHVRLSRMDKRSARVIEMLINEILMEADMENYMSLLELQKVCQDLNKMSHRHHSHHHGTTTTTQQTSTS